MATKIRCERFINWSHNMQYFVVMYIWYKWIEYQVLWLQPEAVLVLIKLPLQVLNGDGVWVRLSSESANHLCTTGETDAWCLQYNTHVGRSLLFPDEEGQIVPLAPRPPTEEPQNNRIRIPHLTGVRSAASSDARIIGGVRHATVVGIQQTYSNELETWAQLDAPTVKHLKLESPTGECWIKVNRSDLETMVYENPQSNY